MDSGLWCNVVQPNVIPDPWYLKLSKLTSTKNIYSSTVSFLRIFSSRDYSPEISDMRFWHFFPKIFRMLFNHFFCHETTFYAILSLFQWLLMSFLRILSSLYYISMAQIAFLKGFSNTVSYICSPRGWLVNQSHHMLRTSRPQRLPLRSETMKGHSGLLLTTPGTRTSEYPLKVSRVATLWCPMSPELEQSPETELE